MSEQFQYQTELKRAQLIVAALIAGVLAFGTVAAVLPLLPEVLDQEFKQPQQGLPLISLVMVFLAGVNVVMAIVLPKLMMAGDADDQQFSPVQSWFGRVIMANVIYEAACLANIVAFVLEQQWWSLVVCGGVLLFMLAMFPTRSQLENSLELQFGPTTTFDNPRDERH